jgi:hypothetical protein
VRVPAMTVIVSLPALTCEDLLNHYEQGNGVHRTYFEVCSDIVLRRVDLAYRTARLPRV